MASIRVLRDGSSGIGGSVSRIKSPRFIRYCLGCITAQHERNLIYFTVSVGMLL
ncbi:Uncharacterised protein [Vibrio cholerae]|nr:Uncharacterised protein [Vibrio cholerae]